MGETSEKWGVTFCVTVCLEFKKREKHQLGRSSPNFLYLKEPSISLQCKELGFSWAQKSLQMVTAAMKLKDTRSLEGK